jgi:signal transduction histidine kinase
MAPILDSRVAEADRRFAAYVAHELRNELTVQRALAEATLADPRADTQALREMGADIISACERQERVLEALLTLAWSDADTCAGSSSTSRRLRPKSCEPAVIPASPSPANWRPLGRPAIPS